MLSQTSYRPARSSSTSRFAGSAGPSARGQECPAAFPERDVKNGTIEPVGPAPSLSQFRRAPRQRRESPGRLSLSGFLLALLGAILPAWGYHRDPSDFVAVGNYFLSLAVGIVAAALLARRIMARRGLSFLLVFACCFPACRWLTWP